ncbi:MAG: arginine--tRNA ligase [Eggerthellaceae bacterium]|nr:arginine--tRNA ligase [Eggerthellaceae bacterium]
MQIREQLEEIVNQAIAAAIAEGALALDEVPAAALERPRDPENGDWASTVAMRSAKLAHANPRDIAQAIVAHLPENDVVKSAEIAGPGFINFRLTEQALQGVVARVREERGDYGRGEVADGPKNVNLEYISANPTGPMHVGHGRWAALGDSMARVMRHAGYDVYEEFYVNDHGTQMDVFGNSIAVRYMQELGHDAEMPEECYGGAYVTDIARGIIEREGNKYEGLSDDERRLAFREIGMHEMLGNQRTLLEKFGTTFDKWFSERDLYVEDADGETAVSRALAAMDAKGYVYEKDDATWFASSEFGDDKDRVLIKANGELTYFTSDMAYHYNKVQRGFDHLIDLWGADHHGYIKRCEAMMEAWGYTGLLEVVLGQLVNLLRDGEPVRMSKRTGEMVTFEELVDEVGVDATRFLMLSRSSDQAVDFDIEVAKKQDSTNPVYYVQYAHARICSILRKAAGDDSAADELARRVVPEGVDLSVLTHGSELALMRKMDDFGELIALAARDRAPYRLTHYAQELASLFHQFYTNCHIIGEEQAVQDARLALADATRILLALTLDLLGVSAPERM